MNIVENAAVGTTIARVAARDADVGLNAEIRYALSVGTRASFGDIFTVDSISGDVIIIGDVDYERAHSYQVHCLKISLFSFNLTIIRRSSRVTQSLQLLWPTFTVEAPCNNQLLTELTYL